MTLFLYFSFLQSILISHYLLKRPVSCWLVKHQHHSVLQWRELKQSESQKTFHSASMMDHPQFRS